MADKENFALDVDCERQGYTVNGVPCKIYLPVKRGGPILLRLYPSSEQKKILEHWWEFSISGEIAFPDGSRRSVHAKAVYWQYEKHEYVHWGADRTDTIMAYEPADLRITYHFARKAGETQPEANMTKGAVWVTPSSLLYHPRFVNPSEGGGFVVETIHSPIYNLPNGTSLTYKNLYRYYKNEAEERVYFDEPVLEFEVEGGREKLERGDFLRSVERLLEVVSFAARHRTVWLGWEAADNDSHTTFYRNNITPPAAKRRSYDDELIPLAEVEEFAGVALASLELIDSAEGTLRAIGYTIPRGREFLDSSFILLYAALETLVLDFRRSKGLEFIFPSVDEFKEFQRQLKKWVKEQPALSADEGRRKLLYDKIPELNRVSFREAFEQFCHDYKVDLTDLWPVVGRPGEVPLSELRNRMVHGDEIDYEQRGVMYCARENLKWAVERMILAVLRWPLEKSRCGPRYLKSARMTMYDWKPYRQMLTG